MFVCTASFQILQRLSSPDQAHYNSIQFTYWLQWHLHRQLRSASLYAQQHRIALKGDLPIGLLLILPLQENSLDYPVESCFVLHECSPGNSAPISLLVEVLSQSSSLECHLSNNH